jgi:transketolase
MSKGLQMRNSFANQLFDEAQNNPQLLLISGDLGFGVLDKFADILPAQYMNLGIAEQSMMSIAGGLASQGFFPFVYSIANFPTFRCLEQIRNDISYMGNRVCIVAVGPGFAYGQLGYSHHAIEDISVMRSIPNLRIYNPSDEVEMKVALKEILSSSEPSYLRLGKGGELALGIESKGDLNSLAKLRPGSHGCLVYSGIIGSEVLKAREILFSKGLEVAVYSIPRIYPAPNIESILQEFQENLILTVEEHTIHGGFGSAFLEWSTNYHQRPRIKNLGVAGNIRNQIGSQAYLRKLHGLDAEGIAGKFVKLYYEKIRQ